MSEEMKAFFRIISGTKEEWLFRKLYKDPTSILGDAEDWDKAEKEYLDLPYYCELMMNNNLTLFIKAALCDSSFLELTEYKIQIWRKFNFFLYDSQEFKIFYPILRDKELIELFDRYETVTFGDIKRYEEKNGSIYKRYHKSFARLFEEYKKFSRLCKHGYSKDDIDRYDEIESEYNRLIIQNLAIQLKERNIENKEEKKAILDIVEEEDPKDSRSYLAYHQLYYTNPYDVNEEIIDRITFKNFVCENRFLDIVEKKLESGSLDGDGLDNAIQIIDLGVQIKKNVSPEAHYLSEVLGDELVSEFDLERAINLENRLYKYRALKRKQKRYPDYISLV